MYTHINVSIYIYISIATLDWSRGTSTAVAPYIHILTHVQPVVFGVSVDLILHSQSVWSLFNKTWQKRRKELDNRLIFEIGETTLPSIRLYTYTELLSGHYL